MISGLALLRGHQVHALRLLIQRGGQLAVNPELIGDVGWQIAAVFSQLFGTRQRQLCFPLPLGVQLIAQRLQIIIQLFGFALMHFAAHARQFLAIVGRELRQFQLVDARFLRRGFGQPCVGLRLNQRRGRGGLILQPAFGFAHGATGVGLLLRQLSKRIADIAGAILLLLRLAALFQQLAADLQDLLIQLGAAHVAANGFSAVGEAGYLLAQIARQAGKIIDNLLILLRLLQRRITFIQKIQRRFQTLYQLWLGSAVLF